MLQVPFERGPLTLGGPRGCRADGTWAATLSWGDITASFAVPSYKHSFEKWQVKSSRGLQAWLSQRGAGGTGSPRRTRSPRASQRWLFRYTQSATSGLLTQAAEDKVYLFIWGGKWEEGKVGGERENLKQMSC